MILLFLMVLAGPAFAADRDADLRRETLVHTKALIALDTSNPPGNEIIAARYIEAALKKDGIASELYTSTGTRTSLVARLKGDGTKRPLLIMCHIDVVPAESKDWTTPPFSPIEKDGYLYGRGSADIKSLCAAGMAVLAYLKRTSAPLARDVIFFAEADEESGASVRHIDALLRDKPELVAAEYGINEGGNSVWKDGKVVEVRVEAAEKEYMDFMMTAKGKAGHSSMPTDDNALARLALAITRLSAHRFPVVLNPVSRGFLREQAKTSEPGLAAAIRAVLEAPEGPSRDDMGLALARLDPELGAMLRDTVTPTMLKAGYKSNVIPGEATATFNARLLPGRKAADMIAEIRRLAGDPTIEFAFEPPTRAPVGAMPIDTPLFRAAVESARGVRVLPYMAAWTTDSQDLRARGTIMYGIDPPLTREDVERVHGDNERVPLAALDWYAGYLRDIVVKTAGK
jgi:acetylornithine deacetylase/succinyl-diaminopimelate desuccinylase-like protein